MKFDDVIATLASDQVIRLASKDVMHRLREVLGDSRTSWAMRAASSSRSVRSSRRSARPDGRRTARKSFHRRSIYFVSAVLVMRAPDRRRERTQELSPCRVQHRCHNACSAQSVREPTKRKV